jgi:signal transduction histidine kinase
MTSVSPRRFTLLSISLIIFACLLVYTYGYIEKVPYIGFLVGTKKGMIVEVYDGKAHDQYLQVGDVIQQIDGQDWQSYIKDRSKLFFREYEPGDKINLLVKRNGLSREVVWQAPGRNPEAVIGRVKTAPWLAYLFWIFGLLTILTIRPTDTRWILLGLINNLFALWAASGFISWSGVYGSSLVVHASTWILVAMLLHFHVFFPHPFERLNKAWIWVGLYLIAGFGAICELFQLLPAGIFYQVGYLGLIGSAILLVLHAWRQGESRREVLLIAGIMSLIFLSIISLQILQGSSELEWISVISVLLLALIPGIYFLIALRLELGGMAAIANRTISYLAFGLAIIIPVSLGLGFFLDRSYQPEERFLLHTIFVMLFGMAMVVLFPYFRSWFERRFLGICLQGDKMLAVYAARLSACSDIEEVVETLRNEIMPSLLVRQAALLRLENIESRGASQYFKPMCVIGISEDELPEAQAIPELLSTADHPGPISIASVPWARQVLALKYKGAVIGMCIMGRRDPDDRYPPQELPFLQTLMMQTTLALVNVDQASLLHGMQREYIRRQDGEFRRLANDLHDAVLPQMALLARLAGEDDEQFEQAYRQASRRIKDVINGLRPDTLEHFGLKVALNELWVESRAQARETSTLVEAELVGRSYRYPQDVEINLFRIVQQALNNALNHANAERIEIHGRLEERRVELSVEDNGLGFDARGQDLLGLLVKRNYGMLTMYERADLIGASLEIDSTPGKGTCITVRWQGNES